MPDCSKNTVLKAIMSERVKLRDATASVLVLKLTEVDGAGDPRTPKEGGYCTSQRPIP